MTKNEALEMAIDAMRKVRPGNGDRHIDIKHRQKYEKYTEAIIILKGLKDEKKVLK